jgi:hypothetical protein
MRAAGPLVLRASPPRTSFADPAPAWADTYARHTSWSDPTARAGRPLTAPGVSVVEGGAAVSTPDVSDPLRYSLTEPAYANAVRTGLS